MRVVSGGVWAGGLGGGEVVGAPERRCLTHLRVLVDGGAVLLLDEQGVALGQHGVLSCCGRML